jgi:hypothetical protein
MQGEAGGGRVALHPVFPLLEDSDLRGAFVPCFLAAQLVACRSLSLLTCPRVPTRGVPHLPPCGICEWVDTKTLRRIASVVKR